MDIDSELVKHIGKIARLDLTEMEIMRFVPELKDILNKFSEVDKIKVKEKPSFQPVEIQLNLRQDKIEKSLSQKEALANSNNKTNGYFKGPKII